MIFVLPILVFKSVGKKRRPVFPQTLLAMSATGFDRPTDATVLYKKGSSGLVGQVRATPQKKKVFHRNDPSAGSPTDTLLRLLLPLNDQVCKSLSRQGAIAGSPMYSPKSSLSHSIGSSDGRCVQRAGT